MEKSEIWFAVSDMGELFCLGHCGDFDQAEEEATNSGINPIWMIDEETAKQWKNVLYDGLKK